MEIREGAITRLEERIFALDYGERMLMEQFGVAGLEGFGLADHHAAAAAAGAIVYYLRETSVTGNGTKSAGHALQHLDRIRFYQQQDALGIDGVSARNLELVTPAFAEDASSGRATTLAFGFGRNGNRNGRAPAAIVDSAAPSLHRGN